MDADDWWVRLPRPARRFSEVEPKTVHCAGSWMDARRRLWLPLRGRGELRISFEIKAMESETPQKFEVVVNGISLGQQEIAPAWQTVRFVLPETAWQRGNERDSF